MAAGWIESSLADEIRQARGNALLLQVRAESYTRDAWVLLDLNDLVGADGCVRIAQGLLAAARDLELSALVG